MWCRRQNACPEVLDFYVMRVLSGESVAAVSKEAGVSYRALQIQVLRAQERNAKMVMGNGHGWRGHPGCMREYGRQRHGPEDALYREETGRTRLQQQQQQRELLPFQDQYIYEIHRDSSNQRGSSEEMEIDHACSAPDAEMEGRADRCVAVDEEETISASEWATEGESYPRKRRKTVR